MKRYLTLKPRVKAKNRPFSQSMQRNYRKPKAPKEDKDQPTLL